MQVADVKTKQFCETSYKKWNVGEAADAPIHLRFTIFPSHMSKAQRQKRSRNWSRNKKENAFLCFFFVLFFVVWIVLFFFVLFWWYDLCFFPLCLLFLWYDLWLLAIENKLNNVFPSTFQERTGWKRASLVSFVLFFWVWLVFFLCLFFCGMTCVFCVFFVVWLVVFFVLFLWYELCFFFLLFFSGMNCVFPYLPGEGC